MGSGQSRDLKYTRFFKEHGFESARTHKTLIYIKLEVSFIFRKMPPFSF